MFPHQQLGVLIIKLDHVEMCLLILISFSFLPICAHHTTNRLTLVTGASKRKLKLFSLVTLGFSGECQKKSRNALHFQFQCHFRCRWPPLVVVVVHGPLPDFSWARSKSMFVLLPTRRLPRNCPRERFSSQRETPPGRTNGKCWPAKLAATSALLLCSFGKFGNANDRRTDGAHICWCVLAHLSSERTRNVTWRDTVKNMGEPTTWLGLGIFREFS